MTPRPPLFAAVPLRLPDQLVNCVPALPTTLIRVQGRTDMAITNIALRRAMPTQEGSALSHGYAWPHPEGQVWAVADEIVATMGELP